MRVLLSIVWVFLTGVLLALTRSERYEKYYHGAPAALELTVKDDRGQPVEGSHVQAYYWRPSGVSDEENKDTNAEGKVTVVGEGYTSVRYFLTKEGYYETEGHAELKMPEKDPEHFWERARWEPIIRDEVLKKKRNPIAGIAWSNARLKAPPVETPIGLDLEKMDWLPPHGVGEQEDVRVTTTPAAVWGGKKMSYNVVRVTFDFPREGDGMQLCEADTFSTFRTGYAADLSRPFVRHLVLDRTDKGIQVDLLPYTHYLTFRVRTQFNEDGTIRSAHYGFLYRLTATPAEFSVSLPFFNPRPNDTNLEFDPERNLVPEKELRRRRAMRP